MRTLIIGGAGFIGKHLSSALVDYAVLDKVSQKESSQAFPYFQGDASDPRTVLNAIQRYKPDAIFHLAANSDIGSGSQNPILDFRDTLLTTSALMQVLKVFPVSKVHFSSSSAVYGVLEGKISEKNNGVFLPISFYGSAKLASEQILESMYSFDPQMKVILFRFPNVVGPNTNHGVIFDLLQKLIRDPFELQVLGDGSQKKPYLHVSELVNAMLTVSDKVTSPLTTLNIGPDSVTTVSEIVEIIKRILGINPKVTYGTRRSGWEGDVPEYLLDTTAMKSFGVNIVNSSNEAVSLAVREIAKQLGM